MIEPLQSNILFYVGRKNKEKHGLRWTLQIRRFPRFARKDRETQTAKYRQLQ